MLYDPKWAPVETKRTVFPLAELIAWLELQPPGAEYDFYDIHGCLLCAFLKAHGYEDPAHDIGFGAETIAGWQLDDYHRIAGDMPWTFGAALERARDARSS